MRRRDFITLLGGTAAWRLEARAQQPERMRRVAVLTGGGDSDTETQARLTAFKEGLEKAGWSEGRNIQTEYRFAIADQERTRTLAEELLRLSPDVFVAHSTLVLSTVQK